MDDNTVTIIGGGIGGLTFANCLQHFGISFQLYEQAPELTDIGAGIGLSQSPIHILDSLGLGTSFRESAALTDRVIIPDKHLNIRREMKTSSDTYCIHRANLIQVLKEKLPQNCIHLGKKVRDISNRKEDHTLFFDDGSEITTNCTVAADGINSVIRKTIFPEISIRPINQVVWRGITEIDVPEKFQRAFLEIWDEDLRFLTIPISEKKSFWLAIDRAEPGGKDNPDTIKDELLDMFRNFHPFVLQLIEGTEDILRNDMGDLGTRKRQWFKDRIVFLGDSIHATTPNLAQGGCQAIEDAWTLAHCLKKYEGDYQKTFSSYYRVRHKKVMNIVSTSWTFGKASLSKNPLFHYGFRTILTHAPEFVIRRQESMLNDLSYVDQI